MEDHSELLIRISGYDNKPAFEQLFQLYHSRLYHFSFSFVKSAELAEEVVQDVFIQFWEKRKKMAGIKHLTSYLFTATKNISLNYLRKYRRIKSIELETVDVPDFKILTTPEDIFITKEMISRINDAINRLPPKCKLIFKLAKEEKLKCREIADLLDISVSTVENQLAIAVKRINLVLPSIVTD